jgi:hypothetical protein
MKNILTRLTVTEISNTTERHILTHEHVYVHIIVFVVGKH